MDAVNSVIWELFPAAYILRVPSHESLSDRTRKFLRQASYCFIGGTNLLSSNITPTGLWRLRNREARIFGQIHTSCIGTGWNDYMSSPTPRTREILRTCLSPSLLHSVRDNYTRDHLMSIGIRAITTSCPTTWSLTPAHCAKIPTSRAKSAVFTLSAWRSNPDHDRSFVELLRRHYATVHFFPQMQDDWNYFQSFGWGDIKMVPATTEGYNRFLEDEDVDFVGTRLHGGIRAIQKGRRALILAIDNRAAELGKDTQLPVIPREETLQIGEWIEGGAATSVRLPEDAINSWKEQYRYETRSTLALPRNDLPDSLFVRVARSAKRALWPH